MLGCIFRREVETRQIGGRLRVAALDRSQWDVVAVVCVACCVLGRKLSFLCGRRRECELPVQLEVGGGYNMRDC